VIYRFRRPFLFFFPFEPDGLFDRGEPFGPDRSFEPDGARPEGTTASDSSVAEPSETAEQDQPAE